MLLAKGYLQRGETVFAKDELKDILRRFAPDSVRVEAAYWLGECHYRLEEYSTAAFHFGRVAEGPHPGWRHDALMRAGDSFLALGELSHASGSFRQARRMSEGVKKGDASYWFGVVLSRQEKHEEAAHAFAAAAGLGVQEADEAAYMAARSAMAARAVSLAESLWIAYVGSHPLSERAEEGLMSLAQLALRQQRETEAGRALQRLLERFPGGAHVSEARLLLAELFLRSGNPSSAEAELRRLLASNPSKRIALQATFALGRALRDGGRERGAVAVFDSLAMEHPGDSLATQGLLEAGDLLYAQGRFAEASARLRGALAGGVPPEGEMRARRLLGWSLYQEGRWAKAVEAFGRLVALPGMDPEVAAEASHMQAQSLAKMESLEAAVAALRSSLEAFPEWSSADHSLILLARLLEAQGRSGEAIDAYLELAGSYVSSDKASEAQLRAAQLMLEEGREAEARDLLESLVSRGEGEALYWLAEVRYRLGQSAVAAERFREFLSVSDPSDPLRDEAWHGLAWSQIRLGEPASAESTLTTMLREVPQSPLASEAYLKLGLLRYDKGRPVEAARTFRGLLQEYPTSEYADQALYWLGWSLAAQDSLEAACSVFAVLHRSYPHSQLAARARLASGKCLLAADRPGEALEELHAALRRRLPSDAVTDAWVGAVQAYLDLGSVAEARGAIDSLLETGGGVGEVPQPMLELAHLWVDAGEHSAAVGLLDSLVTLFPACPEADEAKYLLGIARLRQGDTEDAFRGFQDLADSHDDEIRARSLLAAAQIAMSMGMHQQAVGWYRRAAETATDTTVLRQALFGQAIAHLELEQGEDGTQVLERMITSFPKLKDELWEQASLRWAQLLLQQDDYKRALLVAGAVAETGGEQGMGARLVMGNALRSLGRHREAAREFLAYAAVHPESVEGVRAKYLAALSLMASEQWTEAASVFGDLTADPELSSQALLAGGWCLQKAGQDAEAESSYREVVARFPRTMRSWEARYRLGELLLGTDRASEGELLARQALEEGAGATDWGDDLVLLVGRALEKAGRPKDAVAWYRRIVRDYPDSPLVPYAQSRLRALGETGSP